MATLTVQDLVKSGGMEASYAAASGGGDVMPNDGKTLLHVKNGGGGGAITVTIAAVVASKDVGVGYGLYTRANVAVVVDAAEERFIGPLPDRAFNNASGQAAISYSGVTSVTVAALKMPL